MTEKLIYERHDPVTRRHTELLRDEDGEHYLVKSQDTKPIVESAKRIASDFDRNRRDPHGITHVARIPLVIWQRLNMLGITRDEAAFTKWLNSREARLLRCDDGRKL